MTKDLKAIIVIEDFNREKPGYNHKFNKKSERYKKLWHIGDYWKDPDSDRIIICRYESSYLEIIRVDDELDTDEIIEYAYLDDLI